MIKKILNGYLNGINCGTLYEKSKKFLDDNKGHPDIILKHNWMLGFAAPVYINRDDIYVNKMQQLTMAWGAVKWPGNGPGYNQQKFKQKCNDNGILSECEKAIKTDYIKKVTDKFYDQDGQDVILEGSDQETSKKVIRLVSSIWTKYYIDNNLCLNVLFTTK